MALLRGQSGSQDFNGTYENLIVSSDAQFPFLWSLDNFSSLLRHVGWIQQDNVSEIVPYRGKSFVVVVVVMADLFLQQANESEIEILH